MKLTALKNLLHARNIVAWLRRVPTEKAVKPPSNKAHKAAPENK